MSRPLIQNGIAELERLFEQNKTHPEMLRTLETELTFRSVPRAVTLLQKVRRVLSGREASTVPEQKALFERSSVPLSPPSLAPIITAPASSIKPPATPALSVEEAYKVLRVTPNSSWDEIENARRQLVDKARPDRLQNVSGDKRAVILQEARMANVAHQVLFQIRRA